MVRRNYFDLGPFYGLREGAKKYIFSPKLVTAILVIKNVLFTPFLYASYGRARTMAGMSLLVDNPTARSL